MKFYGFIGLLRVPNDENNIIYDKQGKNYFKGRSPFVIKVRLRPSKGC